MIFDNLSQWKAYVITHWDELHSRIRELSLPEGYQPFVAVILLPLMPSNRAETLALAGFLEKAGIAHPLIDYLMAAGRAEPYPSVSLTALVKQIQEGGASGQHAHLRDLLFRDNTLAAASHDKLFDILISVLQGMATPQTVVAEPRQQVSAERITSEHDVIIAGRDVNMNANDQRRVLIAYLTELRSQWNYLDFSGIVPDPMRHIQTRLHELYTPLDVWRISPLDLSRAEDLARLRQRAVEQDLANSRVSAFTVANDSAHLVITGGPGTGKSTVCGYLTTGLAYACDPDAEKHDGIRGLELLGAGWGHGPLLPVYIRLRQFASDSVHFPRKMKDATSSSLMGYLKVRFPDFYAYLAEYLNKPAPAKSNADTPSDGGGISGAIVILDGLDEIYNPRDRSKAKKVIDHLAESFPGCRILVTCRSAVYRSSSPWCLSQRFAAAELAPYTWEQVSQYVRNWYVCAARNRPVSLGGHEVAQSHAQKYAASLIQTLKSHTHLWSLTRQPLLLTLMVLIHEENRHLPQNRAELYEKTVNLLHRWNPPDEDDHLAAKLQTLNYQRVREVLQLTAFAAQRDRLRYKDNDANIKRPELIDRLLSGDSHADGAGESTDHLLGAAIDDVLEYLATRNGILVADSRDHYRFLHLSIREYLAACALIEQYDEITMPDDIALPADAWKFPENLCDLLRNDPYRWREVALFCGEILGNDRGQDRLWVYLETLLPDMVQAPGEAVGGKYDEGDMYRIAIAAEVWSDNQMRPRRRSQYMIRDQLQHAIQAILSDDRLDAPERTRIEVILHQLDKTRAGAAAVD